MPLTQERLQFVEERILVLGRMIRELTSRQTRYQQNPRVSGLHSVVVQEMYAEQLKLSIERNCLAEHLEAEARANEARAAAFANAEKS